MIFTLSNSIKLFIVKSVAGMVTDLTINYSNFAPLKVLSSVFLTITAPRPHLAYLDAKWHKNVRDYLSKPRLPSGMEPD